MCNQLPSYFSQVTSGSISRYVLSNRKNSIENNLVNSIVNNLVNSIVNNLVRLINIPHARQEVTFETVLLETEYFTTTRKRTTTY